MGPCPCLCRPKLADDDGPPGPTCFGEACEDEGAERNMLSVITNQLYSWQGPLLELREVKQDMISCSEFAKGLLGWYEGARGGANTGAP